MDALAIRKSNWQLIRHVRGSQVVIKCEDGDTFVLPVEEAIRACRSAEKLATFSEQFGELLNRLGSWLTERADEVHRAYLTFETDGVTLAVVRNDSRFNPDFEDALSSLDLAISESGEFDLIHLRVLALPFSSESTVSSFVTASNGFYWPANRD
jgi:hypothetical protein